MFQIHAHVIPAKGSEHNEHVIGAFATVYINYADIDGAYELARYYLTQSGWEVKELEEEYYLIEQEDELEEGQKQLFQEALKDGYSILLLGYEQDNMGT